MARSLVSRWYQRRGQRASDMIPMCLRYCRTRWRRLSFIVWIIWALIATFVIISISPKNSKYRSTPQVIHDLSIQSQLQNKHYADLVEQMKDCRYESTMESTELYEIHKRRVYANIIDLWHYTRNEIKQIVQDVPRLSNSHKVHELLKEIGNRIRSLLSDHNQMSELDGCNAWRRHEASNVSDLIQRRLTYLQNPPDCQRAHKLVCNLQKPCGFGCQLHHAIYCLVFAYATERTLVLDTHEWWYGGDKGWDFFFRPLSDNCTNTFKEKVSDWPSGTSHDVLSVNKRVVRLPFLEALGKEPLFLPLSVPRDLSQRIVRFNGDAASWWIGQLTKYIIRLQPWQQKRIDEIATSLDFKPPIAGMHIRRTDKLGLEATFHSIAEYMLHVKDYFDKLALTTTVVERRVYLASDDVNVLKQARMLYPEYTFLGDATISLLAQPEMRYESTSLEGLLVDLSLLAKCDFVVGTFSSQVGRVVYELMQGNRADASQSFYSLDDIYYFGGQSKHLFYAVVAHKSSDTERQSLKGAMSEIDMEVGDAIHVLGNHLDGYGLGINERTEKYGLFPWYKIMDRVVTYPFPEYKQVPLYVEKT